MRIGRRGSTLRWVSIGFILLAILLLTTQLITFSRSRGAYPAGLQIGNVPVGGLDRDQAAARLLEAYNLPIELQYNDNIIHLDPAIIDFNLNLESMLAAADLVRVGGPFWEEFWSFIWGDQAVTTSIPLDAEYSETLLRDFLENEVGPRYDQAPTAAQPQVGTVNFIPGKPGSAIDIDVAVIQIDNALRSPNRRTIDLALQETAPGRTTFANLEIFLKQAIDNEGFDGMAGVYLLDLQTAQEMHFIYSNGQEISTSPDLAFTASSTIKIPIMVSAFRYLDEPTPVEAASLLSGMIEESGNDPADWLMEQYIDLFRGPLEVTADMQTLGLESTFLAGYFRLGSPLLVRYETPGNLRTDVIIDRDPYSQTTLSELGSLLSDVYQCAQSGGGALTAVFPGEISQSECNEMIRLLDGNNTPFLIEAGAPEGTRIAHKHGWVTDPTGAIRTISDAAIVYTPSGNYVLVIFFYHPIQLVWDPISTLISDLSKTIYNYYNTSIQ